MSGALIFRLVLLVLVAIAVAFFVSRLRGGDFDHGARLSLLPLQDDEGGPADEPAASEKGPVHGSR